MADLNSLNRVILIGFIAGDIEYGETKDTHRPYARFDLATNEIYYTKGSGKNKFRTEYHRIVSWGKVAKTMYKYGKKGYRIGVEGKLRKTVWGGSDGEPIKRKVEVHIEKMIFMNKKSIFEKGDEEKIEEEPLDFDKESDPF